MKKLIILAFLLTLNGISGAFAFDSIIPDGSYQGRLRGDEKGKVHLLVQANPGCEGCFTAIAIDSPNVNSPEVRLVAYTAMPWDASGRKFSLTPINVDANGELTHPDDNPSLMLDLVSGPNHPITFTITPSGSGNLLGFTNSLDFTHSKDSPFNLNSPKIGEYRYHHKRLTNAVISSVRQNPQDRSNEVNMQWFGHILNHGGNYNLKEKFPNVYSFNSVAYLATGKSVSDLPNYIVIFAKRKSQNYVLMVNPIDSRDVLCLILK